MGNVIHKHQLPCGNYYQWVTIVMVTGATILKVAGMEKDLVLWEVHNKEQTMGSSREFLIVGTGVEFTKIRGKLNKYVGTGITNAGMVWHVYEVIEDLDYVPR